MDRDTDTDMDTGADIDADTDISDRKILISNIGLL